MNVLHNHLHFAAGLTRSKTNKWICSHPSILIISISYVLYNLQCGLHWVCVVYLGLISPAPLLLFHSSAVVSPLSPQPHILSRRFSTEATRVEERAGRSSWWWKDFLVFQVQQKRKENTPFEGDWHGIVITWESFWTVLLKYRTTGAKYRMFSNTSTLT